MSVANEQGWAPLRGSLVVIGTIALLSIGGWMERSSIESACQKFNLVIINKQVYSCSIIPQGDNHD